MTPIRVLVADDSATARTALVRLLSAAPEIEVVGQACDGVEAVTLARKLRPDVITMDVRMPHLDGLEATAAIMASCPARILLVCLVSESEQQELSFRAMEVGALEVIAKPASQDSSGLSAWGDRVLEAVRLMAEVPVVTRWRTRGHVTAPPARRRADPALADGSDVAVLGIVASTGGPPALAEILHALPADLSFPILLAQHMARGFVRGLARWASTASRLEICVVSGGERPQPGKVYLAGDGADLVLDTGGVLRCPPSPGGVCPSGDQLLSSLALTYGPRAAGAVLTGMGDDGAKGLMAIRRAGGQTFAQDEATSIVYGMPRVAAQSGAAMTVLPLSEMARAFARLSAPIVKD